jgi:hypothetical protein
MRERARRYLVLVALLLMDIGVLSGATWWLANPRLETGGAIAMAPPGQAASSGWTALRLASGEDNAVRGGPRFIVSGAADAQGNAWLGSEGQGVWTCRAGAWHQFTAKQGLGDDDGCALACDCLGRIWVGHSAHGVSICNGQTWRNYDRFQGPGGSHVFCIANCPVDGDVWLGTEAGLTRYSLKDDAWTTFDRSNGLPADQASGIAFDSTGNIYVALPGIGLAFAKASEEYANWTSVPGPQDMPATPDGAGLPSRIVNAILVTRGDIVYAGTTRGLARSVDHGATWTYVRGANWPLLARGRYMSASADLPAKGASPLREDWITSLAENDAGVLWVGYRTSGLQGFEPSGAVVKGAAKLKVTTIIPLPGAGCMIGTFGGGTMQSGYVYQGGAISRPALAVKPAISADQFPTPGAAPSLDTLESLRRQVEALPPAKNGIEFLGDDWETLGDWVGHYGSATARLMGYRSFHDAAGYSVEATTGPYRKAFMRYYWVTADKDPNRRRGLLNPVDKTRIFCEQNDESYSAQMHPLTQEGPDVFLKITVPAGVHRVSLYFRNFDAHTGNNWLREYPLEGKLPIGMASGAMQPGDDSVIDVNEPSMNGRLQPRDTIDAELAPTVCWSYTPRFWCGVYKQFLIRGQGSYWIKIGRNHSMAGKVQGVFIDRLDAPAEVDTGGQFTWPRPPAAGDFTRADGAIGAAARLWTSLDDAVGRQGYSAICTRARTAAYVAAAAAGADPKLLANWRWSLGAWTATDRDEFDKTFGLAAGGVQ